MSHPSLYTLIRIVKISTCSQVLREVLEMVLLQENVQLLEMKEEVQLGPTYQIHPYLGL